MYTLRRRTGKHYREETLYPSYHKSDTPETRREKRAMRSKTNRAKNDKAAWKRLMLELAANYTPADTTMTLTFSDTWLPKDYDEADRKAKTYVRKLRAFMKKQGEKPLKYHYVVEGKHEKGRFHIHMVSNIPFRYMKTVLALWPYGDYHNQEMDVLPLDANYNVAWAAVANYLTKEGRDRPIGKYLWHKSRNIIFPPETREQVQDSYTIKDNLPTRAFIVERSSFERPTGGGRYEFVWYTRPVNST